ncbi:unnamed protein product [Trichogramma brassicae]|uniref:Nuclear pore protein n=1 Tax=Trichogramma brassicae TaxID=86971 RepID=A0A6H5J3C7_9HYME|nr:unnamed protein product [Trichogramma brassicae]
MGDSDLNELLRKAEQMAADVEGNGELPQVERNLRQILDGSNEIWSQMTQTGSQDNQVQAHLLLGSKGIDLQQISQKLNSLSTRRTFEPLDPIADTDIPSFLKNEKENAILSIIEQVHRDTFEQNRAQTLEHILGEWKQMRTEIMNSMTAPSGELVDLRGTPQRTKIAGSITTNLTNVEAAYAKELQNYNEHVLKGISRPSLFVCFAKAAETFNDKKIVDMWQMVKSMVELPPVPGGDQIKSRTSTIVEQKIVSLARKYLEGRYKEFMNAIVNENLAQAKRGGIPGTLPLVKSFVDRPLWPLVYYCIRAGDLKAALQCINQCGEAFHEFRTALEEAIQDPHRRPSPRSEATLKLHYRTRKISESYYHAHEQPLLYFSMLFLTGQFESAIEFLARGAGAKHLCHAVHLAAAMHEHSLLATSQSVVSPLMSVDPADKHPAKRLNFARLILLYVKRFEASDPKETLQYLFLLRSMKDPYDRNMFAASVAEMVVESPVNNRSLLVGKLDKDRRLPGLVDQFQINTEDIINISAETLYKRGILEDAIMMYDLAGNHEKVLSLICVLLAQIVSQRTSPGSLRSRLQVLSADISSRYQGLPIQAPAELVASFYTLRDLMVFFDQFHNEQYQNALRTIAESKLLPLNVREVDERVTALKHVSPEVSGTLADVLLATMTILYRQYQKLKSSDPGDEIAREQQLKDLRQQARALTSFAGTLPYRMPNETNSKLVQMEILMH